MQKSTGFTLIELMIVVAIVAILATVAYPAFSSYLVKSKRVEAIQTLYSMQLKQEDWRITHPTYTSAATDLINPTSNAHYSYSTSLSGGSYTVTATAKGSQLNDKEGGVSCSPLTLSRNNSKTPAVCWQ
ncbi:type IV pilin protein [Oceanisphaera psychrotolerans]|uniref:Type IV pilin n=1 Tax=Oceanisphaera psychrotolerans TaxID=1414654 RepID=A0A1J4QG42_9GAMM|nr:type IV pilin protein [Oceanisphaera psychrotolerans]OIN10370.1 type IV pilin [Oceanisphaera psychrotolerans]